MDRDSRRAKAAELVEKYGSALFRLCLVMLRNAADAEDAVQEALLRYIERAPEFESAEAERAWLFTVASNRCRDALRAARRHPQLTLDELAGLGAEESGLGLLDALMRLPEKYRLALTLHYVEGYSTGEIASMTGRTPSCVKMRLKKGRELLGKEIFDGE